MYHIDIWTQPTYHKCITVNGDEDLHELARNHYERVKAELVGKLKTDSVITEVSERLASQQGESIVTMKDGRIHIPRNRVTGNFHTMYEVRMEYYKRLKEINDNGHASPPYNLSEFGDIRHLIKAEKNNS